MKREDYTDLTKEHFDNLPPLVPLGSDREQILNELVEAWATTTQSLLFEDKESQISYKHDQIGEHTATLRHIDLRDDNPGALPINLGDLLQEVQNRTPKAQKKTPTYWSPSITPPYAHAVVVVIGCRIRKCNTNDLAPSLHIVLMGSQFDNGWIGFRDTFSGEVNCVNCSFLSSAIFQQATFNGFSFWVGCKFKSVTFARCVFNGVAMFQNCQFNEDARFPHTYFRSIGGVSFVGSKFDTKISLPSFGNKQSCGGAFMGIDFRECDVSSSPRPLRADRWVGMWRLSLTDWINWRWVRTTGNLTALTRVSYLTLAGVPLIAGLWNPLTAWIGKQTGVSLLSSMPTGWLLAFLASLAVVAGQLLYQIFCPDLIRRYSADELIDRTNTSGQSDKSLMPEMLREAFDFMHNAAEIMPHRHSRWFVRRQRRTIWIPDRLSFFEELHPGEVLTDDKENDWRVNEKIYSTDQQLSGEVRKRITIEEGQKARYSIEIFRNRSAAWVAGGLYILAGWMLLTIIGRQLGNIAEASAAPYLARLIGWSRTDYIVWGMSIAIITLTILGSLFANEAISRSADKLRWAVVHWLQKRKSFGKLLHFTSASADH